MRSRNPVDLYEALARILKGGGNKSVQVGATNGSGQSFPPGAFAPVTGWTTTFDPAGVFVPATGLITVPITGYYMVTGGLIFNAVPANTSVFLSILLNSAPPDLLRGSFITSSASGSANVGVSVAGTVHAEQGQTLRLGVTQFSGGSLTLNVGPANYFTLAQVG